MVSNKLLPAKIILVLIILLSFGTVMGVIGYSLSLKKSPPVTVQPTPSSNNGIADWQTYKSEDYGFEIKYPANFKIERNILWSADSTMPESCPDCTISYRFKPINSTIVVNSGSWGAAEDDIEKWIDGKNEEITVSGLYAIKREGKVTQNSPENLYLRSEGKKFEGKQVEVIMLLKDQKIYFLLSTAGDSKIFKQIISTLEFAKEKTSAEEIPNDLANLIIKDITEIIPSCGNKKVTIDDYDFNYQFVDLNNDGTKEVIIVGQSLCGDRTIGGAHAINVPVDVYQKRDIGWYNIASSSGEVVVLDTKTSGYKDLGFTTYAGGGDYAYTTFKWNKQVKKYVESGSTISKGGE